MGAGASSNSSNAATAYKVIDAVSNDDNRAARLRKGGGLRVDAKIPVFCDEANDEITDPSISEVLMAPLRDLADKLTPARRFGSPLSAASGRSSPFRS